METDKLNTVTHSVTLPPATPGAKILIKNNSDQPLMVYGTQTEFVMKPRTDHEFVYPETTKGKIKRLLLSPLLRLLR